MACDFSLVFSYTNNKKKDTIIFPSTLPPPPNYLLIIKRKTQANFFSPLLGLQSAHSYRITLLQLRLLHFVSNFTCHSLVLISCPHKLSDIMLDDTLPFFYFQVVISGKNGRGYHYILANLVRKYTHMQRALIS